MGEWGHWRVDGGWTVLCHMTRESLILPSSYMLASHGLDFCCPHTNTLDGVMPRALHGPEAVQ